MNTTIAIMKARNVTAIASTLSESLDLLDKWKRLGGDRILRAIPFNPQSGKPSVNELRELVKDKRIDAFAEIQTQYFGMAANDPRMEPYYALAEELDIPIGIHMGPGPPGAPYYSSPNYRMRYSSLLLLEDVLLRHPRLRVWAMHAGWPLADDTIATLYAHPQLYVDVGINCYAFPRKQFYSFLQRLVDAGFDVGTAGWFTVLKPNTWFPASRLHERFHYRSSQSAEATTIDNAISPRIILLGRKDRRFVRSALVVLTAGAITSALLWWIMHP